MFFSAPRFAYLIMSSAFTVGLLTSSAHAQRVGSMGGGSMQSTRFSGMMGMPSMTRNTFLGGFGLNAYRALAGTGSNYLSPYGAARAGQASYGGPGSGYGAGGGQSQGGSAPPSSSGAGAGYPPSPANATTGSQQSAERDPLASVRSFSGGLDWPVALRYLTRGGDAKELRGRIDAQVERLAIRGIRRSSQTELVQELQEDVDRLQKLFKRELYDMPTTRQQNANAGRFLGKLGTALESYAKTSTLTAEAK